MCILVLLLIKFDRIWPGKKGKQRLNPENHNQRWLASLGPNLPHNQQWFNLKSKRTGSWNSYIIYGEYCLAKLKMGLKILGIMVERFRKITILAVYIECFSLMINDYSFVYKIFVDRIIEFLIQVNNAMFVFHWLHKRFLAYVYLTRLLKLISCRCLKFYPLK